MATRLNGTCKWFNVKKGFGFITPADGSEDVFVHQTSLNCEGFRSLKDGSPVEYELGQDESNGKLKALNVTGPQGSFVTTASREDFQRANGNFRNSNGPRMGGPRNFGDSPNYNDGGYNRQSFGQQGGAMPPQNGGYPPRNFNNGPNDGRN